MLAHDKAGLMGSDWPSYQRSADSHMTCVCDYIHPYIYAFLFTQVYLTRICSHLLEAVIKSKQCCYINNNYYIVADSFIMFWDSIQLL